MTALCCKISEYVLSNEEKSIRCLALFFQASNYNRDNISDFWNIGIIITADSDIETAWWLVALTH
jgi:hypothetical protein